MTEETKRLPISMKLITRLFSKIRKSETNSYNGSPCWEWIAFVNKKTGYSQFEISKGNLTLGHKVFYQLFVELIPNPLQCDHLCRNKICVNPAHIEIVTAKENVHRSDSPIGINSRKTHCPQGHEYTEQNTYICYNKNKKYRKCKTCADEQSAKYSAKNRERLSKRKALFRELGKENINSEKVKDLLKFLNIE